MSVSEAAVLSQATIDGQPYQANENTPPEIRQFLSQSLSNTRYDSVTHLHHRAKVYLEYIEAEKTLIKDAAVALQDPASQLVQQSGWMIHLERHLWNSESTIKHLDRLKLDRQQLGDKVLETATALEGTPYFRPGRRKLSSPASSVFAMVLKGEAGPLTAEQSTTGFDIAQEGQLVAGRLDIAARKTYRNENRHPANRSRTHVRTVGGLDLSGDAGTLERDKQGVPVMTGTSGSSSDAALATKFGAQQAQASWAAPGLTEEEAKTAMTDLALHFFRSKTTSTSTSPPVLLAEDMNLARGELGLPAKEVEVAQVFTHSYAEVHSGTSLTIDGVDPGNPQAVEQALVGATLKAKERLDAVVGARET